MSGFGAGGSGYLGTDVIEGVMYSYRTNYTSSNNSTKTLSTSSYSTNAIEKQAKSGKGCARITLVE